MLPESINFSQFGEGIEEPIDFGADDPAVERVGEEDTFLFLLKCLPKDRYRVIALLLFIKAEMGYDYTYEDIASLWNHSKASVAKTVKKIRQLLAAKR